MVFLNVPHLHTVIRSPRSEQSPCRVDVHTAERDENSASAPFSDELDDRVRRDKIGGVEVTEDGKKPPCSEALEKHLPCKQTEIKKSTISQRRRAASMYEHKFPAPPLIKQHGLGGKVQT